MKCSPTHVKTMTCMCFVTIPPQTKFGIYRNLSDSQSVCLSWKTWHSLSDRLEYIAYIFTFMCKLTTWPIYLYVCLMELCLFEISNFENITTSALVVKGNINYSWFLLVLNLVLLVSNHLQSYCTGQTQNFGINTGKSNIYTNLYRNFSKISRNTSTKLCRWK